jgi:hypothetical protein
MQAATISSVGVLTRKTSIMEIVGKLLVGLLVALGLSLLVSLPVYWLWNWLMPEIFGLKVITFWQSLGLSLLCSLLFKNSSSSSND